MVKEQYQNFVQQESEAITNKIYDAADGLGTDEDALQQGVSQIYSPEILARVNSSLAAKDSDYQGDTHTMPLEALILDEETHGNSRKYFRTLVNSGAMSDAQIGNTVARELQHEIEGGLGYTSPASVNEVMNLVPEGNRDARLQTERAIGELRPDLQANEGSLTRAYLKADDWDEQKVDQFDSNWVANNSYAPEVDQEHRNGVIGRLCFDYDDSEALHKGLKACNSDPESKDYQYLTQKAVEANQSRGYQVQFTGQEAVQQYLAGRSNDGGEVDVGQLSACNTLLFNSEKPARVQAEEALYGAKNGDLSNVFTSMEPDVYAAMSEIMANGDIPNCGNVQEAYNRAMESADAHEKPSIKANAILSGQVQFSEQEITDFCVELMHSIDENSGKGSSSGFSAEYTNDADYQTEQLKAILQNHPEIIASVKTAVENGDFQKTSTKTMYSAPGAQPQTTTMTTDTKASYLDIINSTQCIVNDEVFFDKNGNQITDPQQIENLRNANLEALSGMREYVAQLEREFRMGVDEEGWLDDTGNALVRYSGIGTDRGDVANRYREAKRMLQQLEAAANGQLRDGSGNVISAQDLAQSIIDKQGELEQVNADYKSSVGTAKMGIVLAPVIIVTTVATGGIGATGWAAVGIGAATTGAVEGVMYGTNLLTSETGNTAENRAAVTSQVLQDTVLAATSMKVGQYAENFAVNGIRAVSSAERAAFTPQTWRILSKVPEGKMKDFMGAVSRTSARLEQASANVGANVISKQANLLKRMVPGISETKLQKAAVLLARGEAAGLEITSDTVQTLGQMYLIDGEFNEQGFVEGMIMSVAGNTIGHATSLKGELGEAGHPKAHIDADGGANIKIGSNEGANVKVGAGGSADAVTTSKTPLLDNIIGDGNKASGIHLGANKALDLKGEINQLITGTNVSGSDLADAYTKLNKIQNRDLRRQLQGQISHAADGLSDAQKVAFQTRRAQHLKADVNNIVVNKSVLEDADVRVINDYIKNETDLEALVQLQQDLQAKRHTSRGTTANFNKLDTAITKRMSQLNTSNVKGALDGSDDVVGGGKVDSEIVVNNEDLYLNGLSPLRNNAAPLPTPIQPTPAQIQPNSMQIEESSPTPPIAGGLSGSSKSQSWFDKLFGNTKKFSPTDAELNTRYSKEKSELKGYDYAEFSMSKQYKNGIENPTTRIIELNNISDITKQTNNGEVCQVGNKLYVSSNGTPVELKMSRNTFERLFPEKGFATIEQQGHNNCWLVATLNSMCNSPSGRTNIYTMFEELPDGAIKLKLPGNKTPMTFPNGVPLKGFEIELGKGSSPAIEMLQQTILARVMKNSAAKGADNVTSLMASDLMEEANRLEHFSRQAIGLLYENQGILSKGKKYIYPDSPDFERQATNYFNNEFNPGEDIVTASWGNPKHQRSIINFDKKTQMITFHDPEFPSVDITCDLETFCSQTPYIDYVDLQNAQIPTSTTAKTPNNAETTKNNTVQTKEIPATNKPDNSTISQNSTPQQVRLSTIEQDVGIIDGKPVKGRVVARFSSGISTIEINGLRYDIATNSEIQIAPNLKLECDSRGFTRVINTTNESPKVKTQQQSTVNNQVEQRGTTSASETSKPAETKVADTPATNTTPKKGFLSSGSTIEIGTINGKPINAKYFELTSNYTARVQIGSKTYEIPQSSSVQIADGIVLKNNKYGQVTFINTQEAISTTPTRKINI